MPELPFIRVVSVTSADPRHPAENLLRPDDGGRWRGAAAGEKQMSVVLEVRGELVGGSRPIHSVHVGNDGAAFVEILVGSSAGGDFQLGMNDLQNHRVGGGKVLQNHRVGAEMAPKP
uniref:DNA-repair protein Xrcc1 N-terminal domain-containing protein n=1 Tax=Malurus cyaneus samueli TaxID=2593467 RepID=A0A8C5TAG5_9PASS